MKNLYFFAAIMAALLACLSVQSTARAQSNLVGTISVQLNLSASGSSSGSGTGSLNIYNDGVLTGVEVESIQENDNLTISIIGQEQFPVWAQGTNLLIAACTASNITTTVNGQWTQDDDYSGPYPGSDDLSATYLGSNGFWYFIPSSETGGSNVFLSAAALYGWETLATLNSGAPFQDLYEGYGADLALDAIESWSFYTTLTNAGIPWTNKINTNMSLTTNGPLEGEIAVTTFTAQATASLKATIVYTPTAVTLPFTASTTNGPASLTVQFDATNIDSSGSAISNWNWNFGDGVTSTLQNPSHTYVTNTNFVVSLVATNIYGVAVSGVGPSNISVGAPSADFSISATNGFMPLLVQFYGPSEDTAGNPIVSWNWSFGNNTFSTLQNPETEYLLTKTKSYTPKLTVTNNLGLAISVSGSNITAYYPLVVFTATPTNGPPPLAVQFTAPSADVLEVPITNWLWKFGDGSTSTNQNPAHTFTNAGVYGVVLTVTNTNGTAPGSLGPSISAGCQTAYTFGAKGYSYNTNLNASTNSDGANPRAGLTLAGGRFFSVMSKGGDFGSGTIYSLDTNGDGVLDELYQFSALPTIGQTNVDGASPVATLVCVGDALYGTAQTGGAFGGGTVFSIGTNGSGFSTLCDFSQGSFPSGVIVVGNLVYGNTGYGGANNTGTIFSAGEGGLAPIHQFSAVTFDTANYSLTNADGAYPLAPLLLGSDGVTLYGTASQGGANGEGALFAVNVSGNGFHVLHNFADGFGQPYGGLIQAGNTLFGTTRLGGTNSSGSVFKINTDGSGYAVLHSFSQSQYDFATLLETNSDGMNPEGALLLNGATLYGTAEGGGANSSGTIFEVDTNDGSGFVTLYSFSALNSDTNLFVQTNLDGANPYSGVTIIGNTLYTTTANGGAAGRGTIFAFSLAEATPPHPSLQIVLTRAGSGGGSASTIVISWPSSQSGYVLEQTSDLGGSGWSPVTAPVTDNGTTRSVTISTASGTMFFRLRE